MRKVFIENLPRGGGDANGKNINKQRINWKDSVGKKVKFIYNNIQGEILIEGYRSELIDDRYRTFLSVRYKNKVKDLRVEHFRRCVIGDLIGVISKEYIYEVGQVLTDLNSGKLKILKQTRIKYKKNSNRAYFYKCLICNNEDKITEASLSSKQGCSVCSNNKTLRGYNDMWTTNPEIAKLLSNKDDGFKYSIGTHKKLVFVCPNCKTIKSILPKDIRYNGLACVCGDGKTYPEKYFNAFIQQFNIKYKYQYSPSWAKKIRYDFYLDNYNAIVETHGRQHYEENFFINRARTLREEQKNDIFKEQLAKSKGLKYIVIDCRESDKDYIKNSIKNSELSNILNLDYVNWENCDKYATRNLVKTVCDYYNKNQVVPSKLCHMFGLSEGTIVKYLKKGEKLGWCDYNSKKHHLKCVVCINTKTVFESLISASHWYGSNTSTCVKRVCEGKGRTAGEHPKIGERLK